MCKNTKKGGKFFISANLYRSAIASHLYRHIYFPYPQLLFDDSLVVEYALELGVEQWWLDAFYYVNKLTYAQYKDYFSLLGLEIEDEKFTMRQLDYTFYKRFEDKLGLYPINDLCMDFFHVVLRKSAANFHERSRIFIFDIEIRQNERIKAGDSIEIITHADGGKCELSYAWYLIYNNEVIEKVWYTKNNTHTFRLESPGLYQIRAFALDAAGTKVSCKSRDISVET